MGDSAMNFSRSARVPGVTCLLLAFALPALGVSCKTQAAMTEAERAPIVEAARQIALDVQGGRSADLKAATVPEVAASFNSIAQSAAALSPLISGATVTVDAIYKLDASDAKPGDDQEQFFCGAADSSSHVTFSIQPAARALRICAGARNRREQTAADCAAAAIAEDRRAVAARRLLPQTAQHGGT